MKHIYYITLIMLTLYACGDDPKPPPLSSKEIQEALLNANIKATQIESEQIDAYVARRKLEVLKTGTGLRYIITKKGKGTLAETGSSVLVKYKVSLLNGVECYASKDDKPEQLIIGKSNAESGLHEALTYLRAGDKAIVIIPSHLAHGLAGDLNKIPIRSTIIYDIEVIAVSE